MYNKGSVDRMFKSESEKFHSSALISYGEACTSETRRLNPFVENSGLRMIDLGEAALSLSVPFLTPTRSSGLRRKVTSVELPLGSKRSEFKDNGKRDIWKT